MLGQRPEGTAPVRREVHRAEKVEEKFKLGIRLYEPSEDGTWRLIRQPAHYEAIGIEPMTIGWYNDHAFLIKDIKNSCDPSFMITSEHYRGSSRLPGMVFATESRVPTDAARMASLQTDFPREWNDVIR